MNKKIFTTKRMGLGGNQVAGKRDLQRNASKKKNGFAERRPTSRGKGSD